MFVISTHTVGVLLLNHLGHHGDGGITLDPAVSSTAMALKGETNLVGISSDKYLSHL